MEYEDIILELELAQDDMAMSISGKCHDDSWMRPMQLSKYERSKRLQIAFDRINALLNNLKAGNKNKD